MVKQEQSSVAALDEQLWMTDQRLGQRIDEALGLLERERLASVALAEAVRKPSSSGQVSPNRAKSPRGLAMARRAAETFAASVDGEASEHSAAGRRGSGLSMAREAAETFAAHGGLAASRLSDRRL